MISENQPLLDAVLDEVRLLPPERREALLAAVRQRVRLRTVCTQSALEPGELPKGALKEQTFLFRKRRGLHRSDDLASWLLAHGLSVPEFVRLMTEETLLSLSSPSETLEPSDILDFLRLDEGAEPLWQRAQAKLSLPRGAGSALLRDEVLRWFFEERRGHKVPGDLAGYAEDLGFVEEEALLEALRREYAFVVKKRSGDISIGVGDPLPPCKVVVVAAPCGEVPARQEVVALEDLRGRFVLVSRELQGSFVQPPDGRAAGELQQLVQARVYSESAADLGGHHVVLLDPRGRLLSGWPAFSSLSQGEIANLIGTWPGSRQAPVLLIPQVFNRATCAELMAYFWQQQGSYLESGITTERGGVLDGDIKRRVDAVVSDPQVEEQILRAMRTRVFPEMRHAFQFSVGQHEAFKLGLYEEGGLFAPHRDDANEKTAHRRFAISVNLNTGDYQGGELSLPEYRATYNVESGSALVYSASILHEVLPVQKGRRLVLVGFFY